MAIRRNQPPLEASVEVYAPPAEVWRTISDLSNMKWASPELVGTWLFGAPRVGRRGINLNRRKRFVWPTVTRITRWKPPSLDEGRGALAFHVWPTDVEWSYEIQPAADGWSRITERRTALVDPSLVVSLTAKLFLGGSDHHDVELLDGMRHTLDHYKQGLDR